ncbi:MAG: trigger factor [Candidatus Dadabacteria bacterium]|nr:trigger factor [Candidatus Dadabacteria bacterium]NIQ14632.1 trigger factor [Candidatus Dadabacteria bacterium]
MKVNIEDLSSTEKKLEVIVPAEKVKEHHDMIFSQIKTTANIKGFRQGKAPKHLIESMYGDSINEEIISKIVSETFEDAIEEASIKPISRPDITPGEVNPKSEFKYSAIFEVIPEFSLKDYEGIELTKEINEVASEQIDETLERLKENHAQSKLIEGKRAAKKGDFVFVDYKGTLEDGKTIEDLNRENVKFLVGEGQLIQEFEDNIIGKKAGEESTFKVTYPEDFSIKEAAGKTVDFTLKINEIHERIFPELDDDFAKDLGLENFNDLKEKIKEDLENQYEQVTNTNLREQILDSLVKNNDFDVPKSLIQNEEMRLKREFANSFQRQGVELPEISGEAHEKFTEKAIESVKGSIILNKIANDNSIEATNEEVDERIKQVAESYQVPFATVKESYEKNNMIESIESTIVEKKVLDYIIEKANINEVLAKKDKVDNKKES